MKGRLVLGVAGCLLLADGLTKWLVATSFRLGESVPLLGDVVRLTYVLNPGAAFGLGLGSLGREVFVGMAVAATLVVLAIIGRTPVAERVRLVALALILGGAVGNLADRVGGAGGVVDFLDVGFGTLRWPVFNLADVGITSGALLLVLLIRRGSPSVETAVGAGVLPGGADGRASGGEGT